MLEGDHALVIRTRKQHYVADVEYAAGKGFRPIVKKVDVGLKVNLTGTCLPHGLRLSVDVSHSSVLGFHTLFRKGEIHGEVQLAQYQVPTVLNRRSQVSCDLPEGSFLVISSGLSEEHEDLRGIAGFASDVFESVGLPKLDKSTTYEQLVIVSRRIEPKSEKRAAAASPSSKTQARGSVSR